MKAASESFKALSFVAIMLCRSRLYSGTVLRANADGSVTPARPGERPFGICYGFYRPDAAGCHVLLQGTVARNAVKFDDGSPVDEATILELSRLGIFCQDSLTA